MRDGDYFLICSKGLTENITDEDIKLLVGPNDKENIDPTGSFRRLAVEKTLDNYSMYLIKVKAGTQKKGIKSGIDSIRKHSGGILRPIFILAVAVISLVGIVFYILKAGTSDPIPEYKRDTTKAQPVDYLRDDSVPSAITAPIRRKPIAAVTDSVSSNNEKPQTITQIDSPANIQTAEKSQPALQNDNSADIQTVEEPAQTSQTPRQTNQAPVTKKGLVGQMLIKFTTDESCKLKITNLDLDEVIDWDLSENDNGTIYLKPGRYSIVATSVISGSQSKTYNFDVKQDEINTTQNLHIKF